MLYSPLNRRSGRLFAVILAVGAVLWHYQGEVAFATDDDLFVSSVTTSDVLRYNGTTGASAGPFATGGLSTPMGITFLANGNMIVNSFSNDTIQEYNAFTGASLGTFNSGDGAALDGPTIGLAINPADSLLYVTSSSTPASATEPNGSVLRYNSTTGAFFDTYLTGLTTPRDLMFLPNGNLLVTDSGIPAIGNFGGVIEYDGVTATTFSPTGSNLSSPFGIALGPDGNVYIANRGDGPNVPSNSVRRYDTSGTHLGIAAVGSGLNDPSDIAFDLEGNLYIANTGGSGGGNVQKWNGATNTFLGFFTSPSGPGLPVGLAFRAVTPIPEPSTLILFAATAACLVGYGWRRKRKLAA